ncbi:hypothetical protein ABEF95_015864 [Exophiala dermatitidis]
MSTSIMHAPLGGRADSPSSKSTLSQQIEHGEGERTPKSSSVSVRSSPKPRSLSDASKPILSPSPAFREPLRRVSKDDSSIPGQSAPSASPRPPSFQIRGLSLHVPLADTQDGQTGSNIPRIPLSPKLDSSQIYGSPSSMLPRRSRGLDYTRACTNLHHSTLAEASPDASPITGRGIQIPSRRGFASNVLDSPSNQSSNALWTSLSNEKTNLSSSVSSVNMLGSDSDSDSDSSSDMAIDREMDDAILNTPAASRINAGLVPGLMNSPGLEWMNNNQPSPAQASLMTFQPNLMSFRRARTHKGKSQHSSSSVSMKSSKPSPGPLSPGILKSVENAGSGYFGTGLTKQQVQSRRESLSLGTNDLHLSDSEEGSNNKPAAGQSASDMDGAGSEGPRGVIRRAVTRRGNLFPKTKGFARIRAQLIEESAPIESEARREAEVIRQVHENDPTAPQPTSPNLQANTGGATEPVEDSIEDMAMEPATTLPLDSFSRQAERNSAGSTFWNNFDERYRTPPPSMLPRDSTSAISDDAMDTPGSALGDNLALRNFNRRSRSSTPLASYPPTAGDVARRVNNKRRREEDFDPIYTKRRAVSPGMSVQSSPVLSQSPVFNSDKVWAKLPPKANGHGLNGHGHGHGDRSNSGGSMNGTKKVGLQGMNETNEGLMSMTID